MTNARDFSFQILRRWTALNDPPFIPDRQDTSWKALAPRDRPFALDLLTGVIRWRGALDVIIASRLKQPLDQLELPVRAILWLGAYQILFQATADYAAVDTAVTLARRVQPRAAGLVNAVLRGITRLLPRMVPVDPARPAPLARRELALDFHTRLCFNENLFPDPQRDLTGHLAAVRSHPAPLVEHFRRLHGDNLAGALLLRNNLRPIVTLRVDASALDVPAAAGLVPHDSAPRFLVAMEGWSESLEEFVSRGRLSPQDPTAAKPVRHIAALSAEGRIAAPRRILDLCAGLGTKSIQLARSFPDAVVWATDIDTVKLTRLAARARALGLANLHAVPLETVHSPSAGVSESAFDLVAVDVPCSNTGVVAKRIQSRWRWPVLDHVALARLQGSLLAQGARLTAPGGILLYATCAIDPAENQRRVTEFLASPQAADLRLVTEESTFPSLDVATAAMHDGGYFALLMRPPA